MRTAVITATVLSLVLFSAARAESLPSIQSVYAAAKAGQLDQARTMVDKVLAAKPGSSKAHFVKAEICASQSDLTCVKNELGAAKRIDAGLAFANPASVRKLESIASGERAIQPARSTGHTGFPWLWLMAGLAIFALLWRMLSRSGQNGQNMTQNPGPVSPTVPGPGMSGMAPGYGSPMQGSSFGASLGKSLAAGAALGAGMVAGEALADSLLHRGSQNLADSSAPDQTPDLGGNDFGIGGDSWDSGGGLDSLDSGGDW
jgi:hypothetical protein